MSDKLKSTDKPVFADLPNVDIQAIIDEERARAENEPEIMIGAGGVLPIPSFICRGIE